MEGCRLLFVYSTSPARASSRSPSRSHQRQVAAQPHPAVRADGVGVGLGHVAARKAIATAKQSAAIILRMKLRALEPAKATLAAKTVKAAQSRASGRTTCMVTVADWSLIREVVGKY